MSLFSLSLPPWFKLALERIASAGEEQARQAKRIADLLEAAGSEVPQELIDQVTATTQNLQSSADALQAAVDANDPQP